MFVIFWGHNQPTPHTWVITRMIEGIGRQSTKNQSNRSRKLIFLNFFSSSLPPPHSRLSCRRLNNNKIKMLADNLFSSTSNLVRLWVSIGVKQQNFSPSSPPSSLIDSYTRWAIIKMRKTHFVEFSVVIKKNQSTLSLGRLSFTFPPIHLEFTFIYISSASSLPLTLFAE